MRLLLTAMHCPKGDLTGNLARHLAVLDQGTRAGCDLVLLPEMSLTGYRPSAAIDLDHPAVEQLVGRTQASTALCFGLVERGAPDDLPFITQVVVAGGAVVAVHRKAHLGEDEDTDFRPGTPAGVFEVAGTSCTLAVCAEIGWEAPYQRPASLVLGPSAPGLYGDRPRTESGWREGFEWWHGCLSDDAGRLLRDGQRLAVSTQCGATDDEDFPGYAALLDGRGTALAELPDWHEGTLVVDVAVSGA